MIEEGDDVLKGDFGVGNAGIEGDCDVWEDLVQRGRSDVCLMSVLIRWSGGGSW